MSEEVRWASTCLGRVGVLTFLIVAMTVATTSQDVDIVPIMPAESIKAEALHKALRSALKDWEDNQKAMRAKYLVVPCVLDSSHPNPKASSRISNNSCMVAGFEYGFKYTSDFKHLVPDQALAPKDVFNCWKVRP